MVWLRKQTTTLQAINVYNWRELVKPAAVYTVVITRACTPLRVYIYIKVKTCRDN
jgi:hypothetical protein